MRIAFSGLLPLVLAACNTPQPLASPAPFIDAVGLTPLAQYTTIEVPTADNIEIIADAGVELRLIPGQPLKNSGIRAEFAVDYPFHDGDTVSYGWNLWIPADFQPDPSNRWWVFGDFHDQPDKNLGETWDSYVPHSAPLIVGYGHVEAGQTVAGFTAEKSSDVLGITYGTDYRPVGMVPFEREQWLSLRLDVTWSRSAAGALTLYVNGAKRVTASGPNMLNNYQHYLKVGQYRDPAISTANRVRLSGISIHTCTSPDCTQYVP